MISPQMSAWVRVWAWAWVSGDGGGGAVLLFRRPTGAQSRLQGPRPRRAAELPGGGGGSAPAAAPPGVPHDTGLGAGAGVWGGSWASRRLSPQKPKTNPPKKGRGKEGKGNFSVRWAAVPRAGAAGSGVRRWVPAARRAPGGDGLRGDPRGQPRARHRGKFSQVSPPRRCAPRCAPAAAVRSGDQRSTFWRRVVSCY